LGYLPVKSLLTCRLVNQTWNTKAIPWIQKNTQTSTYFSRHEFPMFCADFNSTEILPLGTMKVALEDMSWDDSHKFFTKHGSQLRNLEIKFVFGIDKPENLRKLKHILRHVPSLKNLSLIIGDTSKLDPGSFDLQLDEGENVTLTQVERLKLNVWSPLGQEFMSGLFTRLPNLKVFALIPTNSNIQIWEGLSKFLEGSTSFQTFHCPYIGVEARVFLRSMVTQESPKLKELVMSMNIDLILRPRDVSRDLLQAQEEFLKFQADTLEVLNLTIFYKNTDRNFIGPQQKCHLPILKNLRTATFNYNANPENISNNPYLSVEPEHLPNLRNLCIFPRTMQGEFFANSIFASVQKIELCEWGLGNIGLLPKIGSRFPYLNKLTNLVISLNVNAIETIVTSIPDIEDLEIKIFERCVADFPNFNLIIGGVPAEKWALAKEQLANCSGYGTLPCSFLMGTDPPGPSLRDLKRKKAMPIIALN